jgi:hypothetical protein
MKVRPVFFRGIPAPLRSKGPGYCSLRQTSIESANILYRLIPFYESLL